MTKTVLILGGNGKIGKHCAEAFWNADWSVRHYKRGTDMRQAAQGADVIINGLNPPNYHNWAKLIPEITAQVIDAAQSSGATVIIPGNVYCFGDEGGVWDETTPHRPVTEKGQIRADMEAAYRAAGVQTIILRAGNFIDPNRDGDVYSMLMVAKAHKGRLTALAGPDVMQAYAYVPDWARAALALAEKRMQLAAFEDIPFPGHSFTTRDVQDVLEHRLGRKMKISRFPWWLVSLASPFNELMREFRKMRYLFETSHQLSSEKFDQLLPAFHATDLEEVIMAGLSADIHPDQMVRTGGAAFAAE